jgi:hypothetical protein
MEAKATQGTTLEHPSDGVKSWGFWITQSMNFYPLNFLLRKEWNNSKMVKYLNPTLDHY